jgi:protein-tyrosine phosphatase
MIDIHSHILPGMDDGAQDLNESIEMAKHAVKEGVHTIIATPHHCNGIYNNTKQDILKKVEELNTELVVRGISLKILPGQEIRINGEIYENYLLDEIMTVNNANKYLFIEFPKDEIPLYTEKLFFDLQIEGLTPIIVHPERNRVILHKPNILYNLVKNGALSQITASSIVGLFGRNIANLSQYLIGANLTHFIASDSHNIHNRTIKMNIAFRKIEKIFGSTIVQDYQRNAELLVQGKNIDKEMPERVKKKKVLGLF